LRAAHDNGLATFPRRIPPRYIESTVGVRHGPSSVGHRPRFLFRRQAGGVDSLKLNSAKGSRTMTKILIDLIVLVIDLLLFWFYRG
jgi:hypothetical protein